jgi:hypothetical protein
MNASVVGRDTIDLLAAAALTLPELGGGRPSRVHPVGPAASGMSRATIRHMGPSWDPFSPFRV